MITAILMASGLSSRFGDNKLIEKINGKFIFQYTIEQIILSKIDKLIVVCNNKIIVDYCIKNNIAYTINNNSEIGQSQSIKLGVLNSHKSSDYMFFVADQPLLQLEVINTLIDEFIKTKKQFITIPVNNEKKGNPKIFPNKYRKNLLNLYGDFGGRSIIKDNLEKILEVTINDDKSFLDVDTKNDFKIIKKIMLKQ